MEISSVLGSGLSHRAFSAPLPSCFPLISSASPTATRVGDSTFSSATVVLVKETVTEPPASAAPASPKKRHQYSARKAAALEVQQSYDLNSALERLGNTLEAQDLNAILRHFGGLRRWQDLSKIFDWMQQNGKTNASSYSSYIKSMGKNLKPVKALEIYNDILDESARKNVYICNSILSCLVRSGKFVSGMKLFDQMKQDGLTPDIVTYNTLLSGCIKIKHGYSKALELIKELRYNGLEIDCIMYGTLLAVCASNNLRQEAQSYFDQMRVEGHSPNLYHYSSLLNAYSSDGDYKKADEFVQEMKSAGLEPNKVILTTLLKVYVRGGLFEKSRQLLTELEAIGYAEDEMPYCSLMDGLSKAGHIDEAKSLFEEMKKKNVKSDGYAHSIMIAAFCRAELFVDAKLAALDFEDKYNKYDLVMLNTMLCAYCRAGEMESVMRTMKKMDELAISPDYKTFNILIKYFCKEKLYMLAYQTQKDMHSKGHQPEEEICSSLIFHLGRMKAHSEAFSVYNMLRYSKRTMCKALHEKILHILIAGQLLKDAYVVLKDNADVISRPAIKKFATVFVKKGNINLINDVMKVIHGSGYKIDQVLFENAISRYVEQPEKKDMLTQLLQWMPGQGYSVSSSTRNLILKHLHLFDRRITAEILSRHQMMSKTSTST